MAQQHPTYRVDEINFALARSNGQPLDDSALWVEKDGTFAVWDKLRKYAASKQAYVGQMVTYVAADGTVEHYTIGDEAGTLYPFKQHTFTFVDGVLNIVPNSIVSPQTKG